jgi:hypothetical protein
MKFSGKSPHESGLFYLKEVGAIEYTHTVSIPLRFD